MAAMGAVLMEVTSIKSPCAGTAGPTSAITRSVTSMGTEMMVTSACAAASRAVSSVSEVRDEHRVAEVSEELLEPATDAALAADDGHPSGFGVEGNLDLEVGLVVPARPHDHPKQGFDDFCGESERKRVPASVVKQLILALRISDAQAVLAFDGCQIADDLHAALQQRENLLVHGIDAFTHAGQRIVLRVACSQP